MDVGKYPLNKEEAHQLIALMDSPIFQLYLRCNNFEAQQYAAAALQVPYGPDAIEKYRFNQALANNIPRIPVAILEGAQGVIENVPDFNAIYDQLEGI